MTIKGLNKFMGKPIEGEYQKALERLSQSPSSGADSNTNPNLPLIEGYIPIPTANLYFAKERTHLNKNWNETWQALKQENLEMPTLEEFRVSLKYLRDSKDNECKRVYEDITDLKSSWRGNWIDAYFEQRDDGLYLLTKNKTKSEKLQNHLAQNKTPGISLDDWINGINITTQGLPNLNIKDGDLYYWAPVAGRVARFGASPVRAYLNCSRDPSDSNHALGVRAAREKK